MDDIRSGKVKAAFFLFFLVLLIVGGYISVVLLTKDKKVDNDREKEVATTKEESYYLDKSYDYIYFTNIENKNNEWNIIYQDVVFNFKSEEAQALAEELNKENKELKDTYTLISDKKLTEEEREKIVYKNEIYEASYRTDTLYTYKNYASLVSTEYQYDCYNGIKNNGIKAYVFDVSTGKLLSKEELLKAYNKNIDDIKDQIREKLELEQKEEGKEQIDITSTLNLIEENYTIYINKAGYLNVSYLVKFGEVDYNDVIILN